ncbi:MAG: hypothetical protein E2598_07595 [Sphingobium sp.]|nr:hypothetical protein [Sphingobium sp.]
MVFVPHKLTDAQVRAVYIDCKAPPIAGYRSPTYQMVGDKYGISAVMVHKIVSRKSRRGALDRLLPVAVPHG